VSPPPLVGVSTSEVRSAGDRELVSQGEPPRTELALGERYLDAVREAGGMPVILAPVGPDAIDSLLGRLDAVILSGGPDLHPSAYGALPHPELGPTEPELDRFELELARAAVTRRLPVLGICRGMQVLNVALGGSLHQHLPERFGHHDHLRARGSFDGADHDVRLTAGSLAARAAGEELHATKSHHHQGVDRVGDGLAVTGVATIDGLPEALELPGGAFVLGVQWHPEADERSRVIGALVESANAARAPGPKAEVQA